MISQRSLHATVGAKVRLGPAGIHVFHRSTGFNLLLDEVEVPQHSWSAAPRYVSIALTNACDLTCRYCYAPKKPASLEFERVIAWLKELDDAGCLGVGFGGGEPTLYVRFAEVCCFAAKDTGLAVSFTTHAHQLNDALLVELAGAVHFVRVSMDGVGATYEALRGRSFLELCGRLEGVRGLAPFGINFVVNSETLLDLDDAVSVATDFGAVEFLLLPEQPVRGGGGIDPTTAQALRRWVETYRGQVPLAVSEAGAEGIAFCNPLAEETKLRAHAHIDASGMLKRSSYDHCGIDIGQDGVMAALALLQRETDL